MRLKEFSDGTIVQVRQIEHTTPTDRLSIGRGFAASYRIAPENKSCSRVQATLVHQGDLWVLLDGDGVRPSRNGVWYKGERVAEPLLLEKGMVVDIFMGGLDLVQLDSSQEAPTTPDVTVDWSAEFAAIRRDIAGLQEQINLQVERQGQMEQQISQLAANGVAIAELKTDIDDRLDGLAQSIQQAVDIAKHRDAEQDSQIKAHSTMIRRVGLTLAASLMGVTVWTATRSSDATTQAINLVLGLGGGVGGAIVISRDEK